MAYPQQRSTLSTLSTVSRNEGASRSEEDVAPPDAPVFIPMAAPVACREGSGEIPAIAWRTGDPTLATHLQGQQLLSPKLTPSV